MHPAEYVFPVSQVSLPTTSPSPHLGTQVPAALGAYPVVVHEVHFVAEEQVLHDPGQATQPLVESKY